jgi:toxin ParE1/3/4
VKVRWLKEGTISLRSVHAYIALDNLAAAKNVTAKIKASVRRLEDFSESGRIGQIAGTRELIVPGLPYIVIYRITDNVEILRVFHMARRWPDSFS